MNAKKTPSKARPKAQKLTTRTGFPVVAVGASAGGLEACIKLLKALPDSLGMAFVFVPHLDPSHESAFPEILSRATSLPVLEAADGAAVEANHVYVIPRNCQMTIDKGLLRIKERDTARSVNATIDIFMRSLAADQGNNAIGIVLSGTASDGTVGLAAIRGEGGFTFAQDSSAKYDGMPSSAINSGCVDLVLPPEGIARELARIAKHPYLVGQIEMEAVGKTVEAQMAQVFGMLRSATRVDFSEYKTPTISRRVARRMALHKIENLRDYVAFLQRNKIEITALYQDLLINVTSFFREPEAFETLKTVVYPEIWKQRGSSTAPVRVWVPGCSTGEEAYSHAVALFEFIGENRVDLPIQIFGTDLSETAIARARAGLYKETIEADVTPVRLQRFFHKVDGGYQISKTIRDVCVFSSQNVFNDPPFSRIDLLSCRNVMIYLSQSLQRRVVPTFHYALNAGGFLMIGNTEGLFGSGAELFEMADRRQKIYRKRPVPTPVNFGFDVHTNEPGGNTTAVTPSSKTPEQARAPLDLQREADRLLLSRYAPPSVAVNDQLEIIQIKGRTGSYLELPAGKASLNLLKMARPGLLYELQSAIDEARKSGVDAIRRDVHVDGNGGSKTTTIRVTPFRTPIQDTGSFLVVFEPGGNEAPSAPASGEFPSPLSDDDRTMKDKEIAQLKQELAATKEYLQSIIEALESSNEELQSANEEIQSGNEELQSTNEELQTSKEELESANEELHTVNEEMLHRNESLTQLNNDFSNLLNSINLPMAMVGPDLSLRRYTPQAAKVLGLTATDVGRPIARLRLKLKIHDLEQKMLDVIADVRPQQYRVQDAEGDWCDLRLTPYRTADNRIDGVVLTVLTFEKLDGGDHRPARKVATPKGTAAKNKKNGRRN